MSPTDTGVISLFDINFVLHTIDFFKLFNSMTIASISRFNKLSRFVNSFWVHWEYGRKTLYPINSPRSPAVWISLTLNVNSLPTFRVFNFSLSANALFTPAWVTIKQPLSSISPVTITKIASPILNALSSNSLILKTPSLSPPRDTTTSFFPIITIVPVIISPRLYCVILILKSFIFIVLFLKLSKLFFVYIYCFFVKNFEKIKNLQ